MAQKKFFKRRTKAQINNLDIHPITESNGLVDILVELIDLRDTDGLKLIGFPLKPKKYSDEKVKSDKGSRLNEKYGHYIDLKVPKSLEKLRAEKQRPLDFRNEAFDRLAKVPEERIFAQGIKWWTKNHFSFSNILFGHLKYIYEQNMYPEQTEEIRIQNLMLEEDGKKSYDSSSDTYFKGAEVIYHMASSTVGHGRYPIKIVHFPVHDTDYRFAYIWGIKFEYRPSKRSDVPKNELHKTRFDDVDDASRNFVATYLSLIDYYKNVKKNEIPIEMVPFPIFSPLLLDICNVAMNNVLIRDSSIAEPDGFRTLNQDELSTIIARSIAVLGNDSETGHSRAAYFDANKYDKLRHYEWRSYS